MITSLKEFIVKGKVFVLGIFAKVVSLFTLCVDNVIKYVDTFFVSVHELFKSFVAFIQKCLTGPGIFCLSILGIVIVVDIILIGKMGIIKYLYDTLILLIDIITLHTESALIFIGSIIVFMLVSKELKK